MSASVYFLYSVYVEQPRSTYSIEEDDYVPPWADFKLDDITYETFNKRQVGTPHLT